MHMNIKRKLLIGFVLFANSMACSKGATSTTENSVITPSVRYTWSQFVMGVDLSYVNAVEDHGGTYLDSGIVKDPFIIVNKYGANTVRVRLWHSPENWQATLNNGKIYGNLDDAEKTIRRAKSAGMAVNLDLHYSDTWADPGKQEIPNAWKQLSLPVLADSVYQYTYRILTYLKQKNLTPEMIQVGNETNGGMLFSTGKVQNDNWHPFATLLNSGIKAVRDFAATSVVKPKIILHIAKPENADWWTGNIISSGVTDFDILGISYYPNWSNVISLEGVGDIISRLRLNYNKEVMIVETAYPWTSQSNDSYNNIISGSTGFVGYGVSRDEQLRFMIDLTQQVKRAGGSGIMYWEPGWLSSGLKDLWGTGSSWENNTFFDFNGNALPVLQFMHHKY